MNGKTRVAIKQLMIVLLEYISFQGLKSNTYIKIIIISEQAQ